ncbi:MAG TPA: TetR/AcrR family transcriptional regulator [Solirubrobacteraceae bacterium]|nr:TetR/AcrR family transcriptional regulator [Solirubrobacteraceae bacterium]
MTARADVTPNRRGIRSRELVLDAAERVMAEHGFEGATIARVVEEARIPLSSVYHYYGSKDGVLLAVMERGAERFFADLPDWDRQMGRPGEHLAAVLSTTAQTLERHPNFLRLLIVFAVQPPLRASGEVEMVVARVRRLGLDRLREQIALAFGDDPDSAVTIRVARIALAAIDGAFVAAQADPGVRLEDLLEPLAAAAVAVRRRLLTAGR